MIRFSTLIRKPFNSNEADFNPKHLDIFGTTHYCAQDHEKIKNGPEIGFYKKEKFISVAAEKWWWDGDWEYRNYDAVCLEKGKVYFFLDQKYRSTQSVHDIRKMIVDSFSGKTSHRLVMFWMYLEERNGNAPLIKKIDIKRTGRTLTVYKIKDVDAIRGGKDFYICIATSPYEGKKDNPFVDYTTIDFLALANKDEMQKVIKTFRQNDDGINQHRKDIKMLEKSVVDHKQKIQSIEERFEKFAKEFQ